MSARLRTAGTHRNLSWHKRTCTAIRRLNQTLITTPKEKIMIKFKTTKKDNALICKIADRLFAMFPDMTLDRLNIRMDITECHLNGTRLDLKKLLASDDFNFAHDVCGIVKYIDRSNGRLTCCFLPRCAR